MTAFSFSLDDAVTLDMNDPLAHYRSRFHIPIRNNQESIYFCGNSLGLQPKTTRAFVETEMRSWEENGVEGHFREPNPWVDYQQKTKESLSKLLGAGTHEVVSMNNLTTNLHLMLASFYQPTGNRKKLLIEGGAFPSDKYAAESHIARMGGDPISDLVILKPKNGHTFSTEEIIEVIKEIGDELALVLFPGIQYYTGQLFDLKSISSAAHEVGAFAGFDLAHAIGNVPMQLHDWNADFATWCTYKYLNSGPGAVSGIFVHETHANNPSFPKLTGWWGHEPDTRFLMDNNFRPAAGVDAWALSNMNILSMAAHCASLEIFDEAGIAAVREKSIKLTGYLEKILTGDDTINKNIEILTPQDPEQRGAQLSVFFPTNGKKTFDQLISSGMILDWREPNVMRVAPAPLYNSYQDVWNFCSVLHRIFASYGQ